MADELLTHYKRDIQSFTLIPSDGGRFEFSINGKLVYSKLKTDEFPSHEAIHKLIRENSKAKASV